MAVNTERDLMAKIHETLVCGAFLDVFSRVLSTVGILIVGLYKMCIITENSNRNEP